VIRSVAAYATKYARNSSCLGRNLLWCCQRYSCSLDDIFHGYGNDFVYRFCNAQILESHLQASEFLYELILIRDGSFLLPSNLTRDEIDDIITYLCTLQPRCPQDIAQLLITRRNTSKTL
jgi:hypothetical protein